jgi:hypothetical protein
MGPKLDHPAPRRLNSRSRREPTCSRRCYRLYSSRTVPEGDKAYSSPSRRAAFHRYPLGRTLRPDPTRRFLRRPRFRPSRPAGSFHYGARNPPRMRTSTWYRRKWDRRAAAALHRIGHTRSSSTPLSAQVQRIAPSSIFRPPRSPWPRCIPAAARYPLPLPQLRPPHPNHPLRPHRPRRRPCLPHRPFHRCSKRRRSTAASSSRRCRAPRCIQRRAHRRRGSRLRARGPESIGRYRELCDETVFLARRARNTSSHRPPSPLNTRAPDSGSKEAEECLDS